MHDDVGSDSVSGCFITVLCSDSGLFMKHSTFVVVVFCFVLQEKLKTQESRDKIAPQLQTSKNTEERKSILAESVDAKIIEDLKVQLKSVHAQMEDMEKKLMKHIGVLTNDLDEERKQRANMSIEVDRLKKKVAILEGH